MHKYTATDIERFWSKVDREGKSPNQCWEWKAGRTKEGYGVISIKGKIHYAHRISWELEFGAVPEKLCVLHECDNSVCCNPRHLWTGTQTDNMKDRDRKGRTAKGSRHGMAKLNESQVSEIRNRYVKGFTTFTQIAKDYRVSPSMIYFIVKGKHWL